jgi:hypothetical protein
MTTALHSTAVTRPMKPETVANRPTNGVVVHVVTDSEGKEHPVVDDHPVRHNRGRLVERGGRIVWRKEPRYRGSGTLPVLDDPVRDGRVLARTADRLPSDLHREPDLHRGSSVAMKKVGGIIWRRQGEEEPTLRYEEGERDGEFTLGEVARLRGEKPAYTVRIVSRGKRRRDGVKGMESARESQSNASTVAAGESTVCPQEVDAGSETGSESSREDCASLPDFSCEEADGWVPVMVAEDDEGDDWMSLTGSWVWMGEGGEMKDCL